MCNGVFSIDVLNESLGYVPRKIAGCNRKEFV